MRAPTQTEHQRRRNTALSEVAKAAIFTCKGCGRKSIMRKTWLADLARFIRTCRYCGAEQ